ncbi:DUF7093 family protein [Natronosalvus vescus]|uniref:DUF7093 family protein n=1 Tax=Natronosalvus vescus TaxID=2953881 RepID=UPI0020913232|nr:hypothetical protein [Natronosalvus vescus]
MALRCSLLGHDFGETEVDREREERGSEVVVTVTEYEKCLRCGKKTVTSENTEVTALDAGFDADPTPPDESVPAPESTPDTPSDAASDDSLEADADVDVDATVDAHDTGKILDAEAGDTDAPPSEPTEVPSDGEEQSTVPPADAVDDDIDVPTDEHGEPITDDAEILSSDDAERDDRDRGHGEWPDNDDVGPPVGARNEPAAWPEDEPAAWPEDEPEAQADLAADATGTETTFAEDDVEQAAVDDGDDTDADEPVTDDAVFVDADPDPTPEQSGSYTGIASAQRAPNPSESTTSSGTFTEFFCPQCSFVAPGDRGSLRQGDICPECRKGYLGERDR